MIDAIAARQIASTSKAGVADACDMLANSIVDAINRKAKSMGEPLLSPDRFLAFSPELRKP
jgi:hypothetical protein